MKLFEILHFSTKAPPKFCPKKSIFDDFLVEGISGVYRGVEKSQFWPKIHDPGADRSDRKS
jgi:predicted metal-dependent enzyme (double-stranded beta helix superfamily)